MVDLLIKQKKFWKNIKKIHKVISEKDNGIWDAMNKGLNLASGDIIGFLNADDYYYPGCLETVNRYFQKGSIDFLFGSVMKYKLVYGFRPSIVKWSFGSLHITFCRFFY